MSASAGSGTVGRMFFLTFSSSSAAHFLASELNYSASFDMASILAATRGLALKLSGSSPHPMVAAVSSAR
eukprot:10494843-Heterocapsa_arctica.AAC.1